MKSKSFFSILLAVIMCLSIAACGDSKTNDGTLTEGADTTVSVGNDTSSAPADDTASASSDDTISAPSDDTGSAAGDDSASAAGDDTIAAPETTVNTTAAASTELEGEELAAYKLLIPEILPDNTADYTFNRAMSLDGGLENYYLDGNSKAKAEFVNTDNGALWGDAIKFPGAGKDENNRGEITLVPYDEFNVQGAKGIMFYVDMSHLEKKGDQHMCASVTINKNDYRSTQGKAETAVAYYWDGINWQQTTNKDNIKEDGTTLGEACRLTLPDQFKGWVYVPATSYYASASKDADSGYYTECAAVDGKLGGIVMQNMRCYTDGYIFSFDSYVIFDEILYIY